LLSVVKQFSQVNVSIQHSDLCSLSEVESRFIFMQQERQIEAYVE